MTDMRTIADRGGSFYFECLCYSEFMSNEVYSKIICSKEDVIKYFIDYEPFYSGRRESKPWITFNHLFGAKDIGEYDDVTGDVTIDYEWGTINRSRQDGKQEILFTTRWKYPIKAIFQAVSLSHDLQWYVVEMNHIYVSRFYWNGGVKEDYQFIENKYDDWQNAHDDFDSKLEVPDDSVWYYLKESKEPWLNWPSNDICRRYFGKAAYEVEPPGLEEYREKYDNEKDKGFTQ